MLTLPGGGFYFSERYPIRPFALQPLSVACPLPPRAKAGIAAVSASSVESARVCPASVPIGLHQLRAYCRRFRVLSPARPLTECKDTFFFRYGHALQLTFCGRVERRVFRQSICSLVSGATAYLQAVPPPAAVFQTNAGSHVSDSRPHVFRQNSLTASSTLILIFTRHPPPGKACCTH